MNDLSGRGAPGQKVKALRSTEIKNSAEGRPCELQIPGVCSENPARTVWCHIRLPGLAGIALKPPDWLGYYGCDKCHAIQEPREADWADVLLAFAKSLQILVEKGLVSFK